MVWALLVLTLTTTILMKITHKIFFMLDLWLYILDLNVKHVKEIDKELMSIPWDPTSSIQRVELVSDKR